MALAYLHITSSFSPSFKTYMTSLTTCLLFHIQTGHALLIHPVPVSTQCPPDTFSSDVPTQFLPHSIASPATFLRILLFYVLHGSFSTWNQKLAHLTLAIQVTGTMSDSNNKEALYTGCMTDTNFTPKKIRN